MFSGCVFMERKCCRTFVVFGSVRRWNGDNRQLRREDARVSRVMRVRLGEVCNGQAKRVECYLEEGLLK